MTKWDTDSLLTGLRLISSVCLIYSDILWNCHVDLEGNLKAGRQGRTTGDPSSLFRSMEMCSNNSRFSCVERMCTPDEKYLQVKIHVSAHDCESQTMYKYELGEGERERERECECVCVCHMLLKFNLLNNRRMCVYIFSFCKLSAQ